MRRDCVLLLLSLAWVTLIFIPGPAQAVEEYRVSEIGGGVQIWFEAEAFDERIPEGDTYHKLTGEKNALDAPDGAFGEEPGGGFGFAGHIVTDCLKGQPGACIGVGVDVLV